MEEDFFKRLSRGQNRDQFDSATSELSYQFYTFYKEMIDRGLPDDLIKMMLHGWFMQIVHKAIHGEQ